MRNILENLNPEQCRAVENYQGTMLVAAGAGSGKTKVLTSKIAYMISNNVKSKSILAVTFTNKAAKEMRERLSNMLSEELVKYMWIGTFHSICGRILRQDVDALNSKLDKNFTIYDEQDSNSVLKQAIKNLNLDEKAYPVKLLKTVISNAKNRMQNSSDFAMFANNYKSQRLASVFEEYERILEVNNAIDFDDMLMLTVKLLRQNSEIRQKYHDKFKHILVDEFQDTNPAQYELIKLLYTNGKENFEEEGRSLCVVGDADQSIYSWRGADFRIILDFKNDFKNTELIKLEQNYRSTSTILQAANTIIQNNSERLDKTLISTNEQGNKIVLYNALDEIDEANFIVRKIKNSSFDYGDCVILYRTNAQSRAIEEACMSNSLPYKIYGGLKFYDRKEIKDAVAYLKLIYNQQDSESFKRIVNVPKRAIGDTTIKKLQEYANENGISLYEAVLQSDDISEFNSATKKKLSDFCSLISNLASVKDNYTLPEFLSIVIEKTGYIASFHDTVEDQTRVENLQELVNAASNFEPQDQDNVLGEFLSQVALVSDIDNFETETNNVTLMTLHSAKGLEFPIVFLSGLEEGLFPHQRTFNSPSELEEERRLMYVGVTRAEKQLYISYAKRRQLWGEYKYYSPSRFLEEIPPSLIEVIEGDKNSYNSYNYQNSDNKYSAQRQVADSSGYVMPTTSINTNFTGASANSCTRVVKKNVSANAPKPITNYIISKKSQPKLNKEAEEEKIRNFLENNKFKKMLEEQRAKEENIKRKEEEKKKEFTIPVFDIGEQVFHEKLGVGKILDVTTLADSTLYTIDFGALGKKAMDASYAHLTRI